MEEKTINTIFRNRAATYGDRVAVEKKLRGKWLSATWNQYYDRARHTGLGMVASGAEKGDRIAILSENRLEWLYTDMGALGVGCVVVPIYTTLLADDVQYIVENSEAKILFVENRMQLEKALTFIDALPGLEKIVVYEADDADVGRDDVMPFDSFMKMGQELHESDPKRFETLAESIEPADLASIVYTSGTTGRPKGVMITHKNIVAVIRSLDKIKPTFADHTDQTVPFLPLSHVFERVAGHFLGIYAGLTASYAESIDTFVNDVKEKKPTVILAVPRVLEKVYQRILSQVEDQPAWRQAVFRWGYNIGVEMSALREQKKPIPFMMNLKYKIAYNMIFKKLSEALGGRVRWMTASGAPTSREMILFFNASGITVIEGYGMTECCAPATLSGLHDYHIGTVGKPIPDVEVKIAEDGEILIRGDNVFSGYWRMPEETQKTITEDGFVKSGDIGRFNEYGFLEITDRKKDLIITSGGKNIAPQKIEGLFKFDPIFEHFMVIGDRRKFLSALVNINLEEAARIAQMNNIPFEKREDLLENDAFLKIVDDRVAERNSHLASYETIKKYRIIKDSFSQETGELTAAMKLKRNVVREKHEDLIEDMYAEEDTRKKAS